MTRRITKDELIAGYPAKAVRTLMRRLGSLEVFGTAYAVEQAKPLSGTPAEACADLVRAGYLARASKRDIKTAQGALHVIYGAPPYMTITDAGLELARAVGYAPLGRAAADRVIGELLGRVAAVNAPGSPYAFRVKRLEAFGSYIRDTPTLNDLDLFLSLEPTSKANSRDRRSERIQKALEAGRDFRNLGERYSWPRTEVLQFLRARSPYLRFHGETDRALLGGRTRRLWPLQKDGPRPIPPPPPKKRPPPLTARHIAALAAVAVGERPRYFAPHGRLMRTLEDRGLVSLPRGEWQYRLTPAGKDELVLAHLVGEVEQAIEACRDDVNHQVGAAVLAKLARALK